MCLDYFLTKYVDENVVLEVFRPYGLFGQCRKSVIINFQSFKSEVALQLIEIVASCFLFRVQNIDCQVDLYTVCDTIEIYQYQQYYNFVIIN